MDEERRRQCNNCYWWQHSYGCKGTCIMCYVQSSTSNYVCMYHQFDEEVEERKRRRAERRR